MKRNGVWIYKGLYGNGTAFSPFLPLYECSNCKVCSVTQFDVCPECRSNMKKEGEKK